jgi:putative ABC transport system permease protein
MNLFRLSIYYIKSRLLTNSLLCVLLAIGVASISLLLHFNQQVSQRLNNDSRGIDLVVGAKGSPLQLILSSVFHMDIPTGNILMSEAEKLKLHPMVQQSIPLALGDAYRGFRIVGTETSYITHYKGTLAQGTLFTQPMQAVLGARVANEARLKIGSTFAGSHGISGEGEEHADQVYKVVGILQPMGSVLDRLILTAVESVWRVHGSEAQNHAAHEDHVDDDKKQADHHSDEKHEEGHTSTNNEGDIEASDEITALLITFKSKIAAISLPREINRNTSMQAASPAFETARLLTFLGIGLDTLKLFGGILMLSAILGMLIALYNAMQERQYDTALMRVMGASKATVMKQIVLEVGLLLLIGAVGGLFISHLTLSLLSILFDNLRDVGFTPFVFLASEVYVIFGLLFVGLLVSLIPALTAYRVDVSHTLSRG